ncbi:MAG: hypothetical protein ACYC7E_07035 [Armatimonadota bacterium]
MIYLPIIVDEHGDLMVFTDIDYAQRYLEAIDVRNGEYIVFDSAGDILDISAINNQVVISEKVEPENKAVELKEKLIKYLANIGQVKAIANPEKHVLQKMTLDELVALGLQYKVS